MYHISTKTIKNHINWKFSFDITEINDILKYEDTFEFLKWTASVCFNKMIAGLISIRDPDSNVLNSFVNIYKYWIAYCGVVVCRIVLNGVMVVVSFTYGAMHPSTLKESRRVFSGKGGYNWAPIPTHNVITRPEIKPTKPPWRNS